MSTATAAAMIADETTAIVVHSRGPRRVGGIFVVGERPGRVEAATGRPFSGPSGKLQETFLSQHGLSSHGWYVTNVCRSYHPDNADPTPADVAYWSDYLQCDIDELQPRFIIAAGRFAVAWFLGDDITLDMVAGTAQRSPKAPSAVVLPVYHPAFGLHDSDKLVDVWASYTRAAEMITGKRSAEPLVDEYPDAEYEDITGIDAAKILRHYHETAPGLPIAIDTEGTPADPWSIQFACVRGGGYVLRCDQKDFDLGINALASYAHLTSVVVLHNAMYDLEMCRVMGLDLSNPSIRLFDTRYAAYIMRTEPQGLKPLLYRWCGMRQASYEDTIGPIALEQQLDYLGRILALSDEDGWPRPDPRVEHSNDGTSRLYTPQPIERRAEAILADYYSEKVDKDGSRVDPHKRWRQVDPDLRRMVEARMGAMPIGTLRDIPLDQAIRYAGRDADGTLRLYYRFEPELRRLKLDGLMNDGCRVLPAFEEMQSNGMPFDRRYCERKSDEMWAAMCRIGSRISSRYYGGKPFNPASSDQVAALMRRRGLTGEKKSKKTGKMSTAKKSIEHLRYTDTAMADVIEWREHQKMRDAFYDPIVERLTDAGVEYGSIRSHINPYRVASRRISSSDPNLTAIPVRNDLGVAVRDGCVAPDGYLLGSYDLSQIEMRYMCHVSGDPLMRRFFTSVNPATGRDYDMHAETASRIFGIDIRDVDEKKHRYPAKRAGFGIITNIMGPGLLDQLRMFGCEGWDVDSCDRLIEEWLNVYKGVRRFLDDCRAEVRERGVVRDHWGMPRYLPGVWSDDRRVQAEAERAASSMKIQGGAQGLMQRSMTWMYPHIRDIRASGVDVRLLLQIHDEIILLCPEEYTDVIGVICVEALTEHCGISLDVPVKASGAWARSWGSLK